MFPLTGPLIGRGRLRVDPGDAPPLDVSPSAEDRILEKDIGSAIRGAGVYAAMSAQFVQGPMQ